MPDQQGPKTQLTLSTKDLFLALSTPNAFTNVLFLWIANSVLSFLYTNKKICAFWKLFAGPCLFVYTTHIGHQR